MRNKLILIFASAIFTALAFPPYKFGFIIYFAPILLLYLLENIEAREAFGIGYLWGLVFNLAALYGIFWATIPGAFGGIAFIALVPAVICWIYRLVANRSQVLGLALWPLLWVSWDFLRTLSDFNFPWTDYGYTQSYYLPLIQISDITGVFGISLMIHIINILAYSLIRFQLGRFGQRLILIFAILLPISFLIYGYVRLPAKSEPGTLKIALAQGNIGPDIKWENGGDKYSLDTYLELTHQAAAESISLVIWPETATPFYLLHEPTRFRSLKASIDSLRINLLTGTPEYERAGDNEYIYFNAAALISPNKRNVQTYSKIKLVPMSERIPFSGRFKKLKDIHLGQADFSSGREMTVFSFNGYKFATLICFESAFSGYCAEFCRRGAEFLVVITNDMWFGPSSMPYQHAQMSVFRAIENRVPVVRCANTGISMFIDRWGRVHDETRTFVKALAVDYIKPEPSSSLYNHWGDWLAHGCIIGSIIIIAVAFLKRRKYIA
jgi:apolipoprotein N-acyltransferase